MRFKPVVVSLVALVVTTVALSAQRGGGWYSIRRPTANTFKGDFTFCRIAFRAGYGG